MPVYEHAPPKSLLVVLSFCMIILFATGVSADIIEVPYDMYSIQSAINIADSGDTVLVYPGTYSVRLTFGGKMITVTSLNGPGVTIMTQYLSGDPLVQFLDGETNAAELSGFTLRDAVDAPVISISASSPTVKNNHFTNHNGLMQDHAVIKVTGDAHPDINHNLFYDNRNAWGVIWSNADSIRVVNNTIAHATRGMVIYSANSIVKNNIVTGCSQYAFYNNLLPMTRQYNDFWNNTTDYYGGMAADPTDLAVNPFFVDTAAADYSLEWGSQCIDAGDPGMEFLDPDGTRNDVGAFYYDQTPPQLLAYSPTMHAPGVPVGTDIVLDFNLPMDTSTITDSAVFVYSANLGRPFGELEYDDELMRAVFNPAFSLRAGDNIRVIMSEAVRSERHIPPESPFIWSFTAEVVGGHGHFIADSSYTVGTSPYAVVAADFNGDYDLDLATADFGANSVSILGNCGNGTFGAHGTYAVDAGPLALSAADFDADGDPDLVTPGWGANTVSVLLNNGDGTFAPYVIYDVGNAPGAVTTADLDGDGYHDIITANAYSDDVSVLINNGDGTFAAHQTWPVNNYPRGVTAADLDRDGDIDLVTTNRNPDRVSVLRNNGDGTFASKMTYTVGAAPHTVCAVDLDGDRCIDLAVENEQDDNVSVLINNGNGAFAPHVLYPVGDAPYGTCAGDFDGDGDFDLAIATTGTDAISVLLNHGDATFAPYASCAVLGDMPNAVTAADFEGNGMLGLASADRQPPYSVTVLRNLPIANHPPVLSEIGSQTVEEGQILNFDVFAVDPDEDSLTLSAENFPSGAQFNDHGDGSAEFIWNVPYGMIGIYNIWFITNDGELADSEQVEITVTPAPPVVGDITVDGVVPADHVIDHTPLIAWDFIDPGDDNIQTLVEIRVGTDDDWSVAEMWDPGALTTSDTFMVYDGASLMDGAIYHLRLRVYHELAVSDWFEMIFRMNTAPTEPIPMHPADNTIIASYVPVLYMLNSWDAEGDIKHYDYEVYLDSTAVDPLYAAADMVEQPDSTGWAVSPALAENQSYCWRGRGFDGFEYSSWSRFETFRINAVEEPPQQFLVIEPGYSGLIIHDLLPTFSWLEAVEFDPGDSVHYSLQIATDSTFNFVQTVDSIWDINHQLATGLLYNTSYWWRVKATDNTDLSTVSTNVLSFNTWRLGDADNDWSVNLLDVLFLIDYLYNIPHGPAPDPLKAGDMNADCLINLLDILYLIDYLYGTPPGPEPLVGCE